MPPNIVFITCHDLGKHLGCYGQSTVNSPVLDQLAGQGVIFDRSFCTAPQCSPSRAALHTGRHAHTNGMMGLAHSSFAWRMHAREQHLAKRLKKIGYQTALVGVQHLTSHQQASSLGYDTVIPGNHARTEAGPNAAAWLAQVNTNRPFYLEVGFYEPHRPYDQGSDTSRGVAIPPYIPNTPQAQQDFAALQGSIKALDDGAGMVLDALDARGLRANTWVIFVTDHGLAMPRAKCTLYDPGIETALIMRWPEGGLSGGRRINGMISHVDIVPTILQALGRARPANLHGRSFWPLLKNQTYRPNEQVFVEKTFHTAYEPMRGIRTARYKLIVNLEIDIAINAPSDVQNSPVYPTMLAEITRLRPHVELYDLQADPLERDNLAGQAQVASTEKGLKQRLLAWMKSTKDPILKGPIASPYNKSALQKLGAKT